MWGNHGVELFSKLVFHHLLWGTALFAVLWSLLRVARLNAMAKYRIWTASLLVQLTLPAVLLLPSPGLSPNPTFRVQIESELPSVPEVAVTTPASPAASVVAPGVSPQASPEAAVVPAPEPASPAKIEAVEPPAKVVQAESVPKAERAPVPAASLRAAEVLAAPESSSVEPVLSPKSRKDNAIFGGLLLGLKAGFRQVVRALTRLGIWGLALWASITAWMLFGLLKGLRHIVRIKAQSLPYEGTLAPWFEQTLIERGITRPVQLRTTDLIATPMTAGFFKPVVLLPTQIARILPAENLKYVVLHELAHIERRDDWTNLLQKFAEALFFFHPAVRLAGRQLNVTREMACDDWVIVHSGANRQYAFSLLKIFEFAQNGHSNLAAMVGAVEGKKQLVQRVESLLDSKAPRRSSRSPFGIYGLAATVFGLGYLSFAVAAPRLEPAPVKAIIDSLETQDQQNRENETAQAKASEDQQRQTELENRELEQQRRQLEEQRASMESKMRRDLDQVRTESVARQRTLELKLREIQEKYRSKLGATPIQKALRVLTEREAKLRRELAAKPDKAHRRELENRLEWIQEKRSELEQRAVEYQQRLETELASQRQEIQDQVAERLAEIERTVSENVSTKQEELTEQMAELEARLVEERKSLHEHYSEEHEEMRRAYEEEMREMARNLEEERGQLAEEMSDRADEMAEAMSEMNEELAEQMADFDEDLAEGVEDVDDVDVLEDIEDIDDIDDLKRDRHRSGTSRTTIENDDFRLEMYGNVQFSDDESDITSISPGGSFQLERLKAKPREKFVIKADGSGTLSYAYMVGNKQEASGDGVRSILAKELPKMLWESGMSSPNRLEHMVATDGLRTTMSRIKSIGSDFSRSRYYRILITNGNLADNDLLLIARDISDIGSDFEKSRSYRTLLKSTQSQQVISEVLSGIDSIGSDFELRRVYSSLSGNVSLTPENRTALLHRIQEMGSDFEKSRVLRGIVGQMPLDATYFQAVTSIDSDFEKSRLLNWVIHNGEESEPLLKEILQATDTIDSDHEKTGTLLTFIRTYQIPDSLRETLDKVVQGVDSDHERKKVERALSH